MGRKILFSLVGFQLFLGFFLASEVQAGGFITTIQLYDLRNLSATHDRLLVTSEATYVGPLDPDDHSWFIESFARVPAGNQFERTGNGRSGVGVMAGQTITCDVNCGPDVAVAKCNPQGIGTTYRGRTLVGIYHQFGPETESKLMSPGSTVCWHSCPDDGEDHELPPDDPDSVP